MIVLNSFLTLDGVGQAPGLPDEDPSDGFVHGGWQAPLFTEQLGAIVGDWHDQPAGLLLGRRTYEILGAYWPTVPDSHPHAEFAKVLNAAPKYVASRRLQTLDWGPATLLGEDVVSAVETLKDQEPGRLLVIGSLDFAQTLMRHDLVDEYRLAVFPVVLGQGKRLFGKGAIPAGLDLVSGTTTDAGVFAGVYRPVGSPRYGSHAL